MRVFVVFIILFTSIQSFSQGFVMNISSDLLGKSKKEVLLYMKNLGYSKPEKNSYGDGVTYTSNKSDCIDMNFKDDKLIEISNSYYFESINQSTDKLNFIIKDVYPQFGYPRYYFGLPGVIPSETLSVSDVKVNLLMFNDPNVHVYFWLLSDRTVYLSQNYGKRIKFTVELNPYYK